MPVGTLPQALRPGQFVWDPAAAPLGPVVMVVSIPEQRGYVYRNGFRIGVTTVSTGRAGHQTPTGVFTILRRTKIIIPQFTTMLCLIPNVSPGEV
jgi:hypothetical protein